MLYIDEVNLLPDHLADALLDAVASGVHVVEREGFSASQAADFVLVGSMNPEEGALRPQLLDRFALAVDVEAPSDVAMRCEVLERRLAFDRDPEAFDRSWSETQRVRWRRRWPRRRRESASVAIPREMLHYVATRVAEHDVRSLRADLAVVRASRAHAAFDGAEAVTAVACRGGPSAGAGASDARQASIADSAAFAPTFRRPVSSERPTTVRWQPAGTRLRGRIGRGAAVDGRACRSSRRPCRR